MTLQSRAAGRRGVTLVEILVVITVIVLLVGLLVPSVQGGRETWRRTQCGNNLRELAAGFGAHEAVHGFLPSGGWGFLWVGEPDRGFDQDVARDMSTAPLQDTRGYGGQWNFGSAHPVGWLGVMCDGSVRAFSYTTDVVTVLRPAGEPPRCTRRRRVPLSEAHSP